ncbi:hypothetical protein Sjap_009296 [Stephania japonica]|uniref:Uncharacterized protein n=1 Tax=Stephania japonica TaxID=461633 RepID=A0AAP0JR76_9MAGN
MASDGYTMSDTTNFSSPMPAIGLYIAGATLVCLLLMLCDVLNGIRQRKPWIPCHFFVLNSFTLTLLSVATKLSVDLTTSMPSAYDQLSKLCGTAFICISIGFFRPSIVDMNESELSANLASLTVIVITLAVNISLQITTGAIFLFKVEHVIILVIMFLLLGMTNSVHSSFSEYYNEPFRKALEREPKNMQTIKRWYLYSYMTSPQLLFCRVYFKAAVSLLCTTCFACLSQAVFRAYALEGLRFHKEVSDYKWSMWAVVGLQILAILIGTLTIVCRWISLTGEIRSPVLLTLNKDGVHNFYKLYLLMQRNWDIYYLSLDFPRVVSRTVRVLQNIINSLLFPISICSACIDKVALSISWKAMVCLKFSFGFVKCKNQRENGDDERVPKLMKELGAEPVSDLSSGYLLQKSSRDMKMFIAKHSAHPMHSLEQFLGRTHGSTLLKQISEGGDELILLVYLVRMADALAPSTHSVLLVSAFDEAFETIEFIQEKTKVSSALSKAKRNVAKDIWMSRNMNNHWFQKDFIKQLKVDDNPGYCLHGILGIVQKSPLLRFAQQEVSDIVDIISKPRFDMEESYGLMEQLFVELLYWFIDQLPDVIFTSLKESKTGKDFEENAKLSLKFVSRLNLLKIESLHQSISSNICSFMANNRHDMSEEDDDDNSRPSPIHEDEIVQV